MQWLIWEMSCFDKHDGNCALGATYDHTRVLRISSSDYKHSQGCHYNCNCNGVIDSCKYYLDKWQRFFSCGYRQCDFVRDGRIHFSRLWSEHGVQVILWTNFLSMDFSNLSHFANNSVKNGKTCFLGGNSRVAQWIACWAHNPEVRGSKPCSALQKTFLFFHKFDFT